MWRGVCVEGVCVCVYGMGDMWRVCEDVENVNDVWRVCGECGVCVGGVECACREGVCGRGGVCM